ncbi:hypothetical protein TNCT_426091 [Trichonephila clavata]|uniref:Uncharacterized protein n=1 Tax=Trichonephila clavata TaxID=2740835 RepID=A0A8X6IWJ9_TRICU|nr:hypothetical protein TNCT_426091 [Trichonephila clavata]
MIPSLLREQDRITRRPVPKCSVVPSDQKHSPPPPSRAQPPLLSSAVTELPKPKRLKAKVPLPIPPIAATGAALAEEVCTRKTLKKTKHLMGDDILLIYNVSCRKILHQVEVLLKKWSGSRLGTTLFGNFEVTEFKR